jgi:hypothetical protein
MHRYYNLTVTLLDLDPPIWRRFLLPVSATFLDLHKAIQAASGTWRDYHLFEFKNVPTLDAQLVAGIPDSDWPEYVVEQAKAVRLKDFFTETPEVSCIYRYDFGDSWRCLVKSNGVEVLPYKFKRALMDGALAFPPEDCGGIGGYDECCAILDMEDEDFETDPDAADRKKWLGDWHWKDFDLVKAKGKFDR